MKKTEEQISYNMRKVKNKDSDIELLLRKELWRRGIRYRKNVKTIYGKPDIAFIGLKIAVFCDSEFWHGFDWENRKKDFKSHQGFWIPKIERNIARDKEVTDLLESDGWIVIRFWGKKIKKETALCADIIQNVVEERKRCTKQ
jgi:DNA mismatch endonuclease (patch repair protein)